ncbi:MAG: hypothetical protein C0622_13945 [Desulfuromonas sp.]|nr:MAG: hypothetical protein C0622_13945 [Desulfuromonas sp.]
MAQDTYLIVEQQQKPSEALPELIKELVHKHQLDGYQSRQRLVGRGLSLLTRGEKAALEKISPRLREAGYRHWIVTPRTPGFMPQRLRALKSDSEKILFGCQKQTFSYPRGGKILAVFADLSGNLAAQSVKQLISSNAYHGRDNLQHISEDKIIRSILQGMPVLDLYLIDEEQDVSAAVRLLPGKFDPKGLGDRATLSARQNLLKVLELAREYAGEFHLYTDFGLVAFPGCTLRKENSDDPETIRSNLISLARYGWLMADLITAETLAPDEEEEDDDLTRATAAALLLQNPALAASGQAEEILPLAREISREIEAEEAPRTEQPAAATPGLPPPPEGHTSVPWNRPGFWIGGGGFGAVIAIVFIFGDQDWFRYAAYHAFASGGAPLAAAVLMLWYGFYFFGLRRQIENTPTSKVRSVAMGMVEVKGTARRQYALLSPMTQTPCVFYRLTKYRRDQNKHQWRVRSVNSSANVPFYLEDETGRVEVDPSSGSVTPRTKQEGAPGEELSIFSMSDDRDEKWVEEVIVEGTLLYVLGFAAVKRGNEPSLHERKIEALRELKHDRQQLMAFDSDGDGKISDDEWDSARAAVEDQVLRESLAARQKRKKQEEHVVISKKKGRPLIISETHSEERLTARYLFYSVTLLIASTAAVGGSIYLLLNYLKG